MLVRLITSDDFIETYVKAIQRGVPFLLEKLDVRGQARTRSAFGVSAAQSSNWWRVPAVRQRWNTLITGNPHQPYEPYTAERFFSANTRLLSIGSGVCSHELVFAAQPQVAHVTCTDLVPELLAQARERAREQKLHNVDFIAGDVANLPLYQQYDVVLFHSSLHHFYDIRKALDELVRPRLRPGGLLVVHEYVGPNRNQFSRKQVSAIQTALLQLPERYRQRYRTQLVKRTYSGPGLLRMRIADPSECADSSAILPALHERYEVIEEKALGGNLLMGLLKDIAHHFEDPDENGQALLEQLFALEDAFLTEEPSDFMFGVYRSPHEDA